MRTLKTVWSVGLVLVAGSATVFGQMHKVTKPETVVRAVGVYEWTGEMAKPTASRLIPVTLAIDKHLEDAGLYLARPVPFALDTGNIYELEEAGVPKGTLDLVYARHLQAVNVAEAYDDGWFGYGTFHGLVAPKKPVIRKLTPARTAGIETASSAADPDKPHFSNKAGQPTAPGSAGADSTKADAGSTKADGSKKADGASPESDPDRPHLSKKQDAPAAGDEAKTGKADTTGSGTTPAGDPDRPTMKGRGGKDAADTSSTASTASSGGGSETASADDPDRPTLKRHSVEDAKKKAKAEEQASVTGTGSLNNDPDRPNLHRGKPAHALTEADLPKLSGLPADLRQMVAVSDAANRPAHDFARAWEDDAERAAVLGKMQAMAQAQLAMYGGPTATSAAPQANKAAGAGSSAGAGRVANRATSKLRRPLQPVRIAVIPLLDEQLKGYLLSYGDVPTFVYQAHTQGDGASLRYVTIVAQRDAQGEPKMVLHAVTDATHLDRTARLRLVDAVDVDASNRASLLFEMRGQTSRQFGVYRVLGLQAEQIFSTGTMQ